MNGNVSNFLDWIWKLRTQKCMTNDNNCTICIIVSYISIKPSKSVYFVDKYTITFVKCVL